MAKWGFVWPEGCFCGQIVFFPVKNTIFDFSSGEVVTVARRCLGFVSAGGKGGLSKQTWQGMGWERRLLKQTLQAKSGERTFES